MKKLAALTIGGSIVGIGLILVGIWMRWGNGSVFAFPNPNSAPWGFALLGIFVITMHSGDHLEKSFRGTAQSAWNQTRRIGRCIGSQSSDDFFIEQGRYNPSILLAFRIARYFDLSIEDIFLYEE